MYGISILTIMLMQDLVFGGQVMNLIKRLLNSLTNIL